MAVESDARRRASSPRRTSPTSRRRACGPAAVEQLIPELPTPVGAVVLDPPRSGAGADLCRAIAVRGAARRSSTSPAIRPRSAGTRRRCAAAGYRLDALRAFDAFPQTHHVECVARFVPA